MPSSSMLCPFSAICGDGNATSMACGVPVAGGGALQSRGRRLSARNSLHPTPNQRVWPRLPNSPLGTRGSAPAMSPEEASTEPRAPTSPATFPFPEDLPGRESSPHEPLTDAQPMHPGRQYVIMDGLSLFSGTGGRTLCDEIQGPRPPADCWEFFSF